MELSGQGPEIERHVPRLFLGSNSPSVLLWMDLDDTGPTRTKAHRVLSVSGEGSTISRAVKYGLGRDHPTRAQRKHLV